MSQLCKTWLVGALVGLSTAVMAQTQADPAQLEQAQSIGATIGKPLGMMLFAYLALKWINRKKDRDDDEPRGFLGLRVKPWVVWLVVIGGLGLLMARSG